MSGVLALAVPNNEHIAPIIIPMSIAKIINPQNKKAFIPNAFTTIFPTVPAALLPILTTLLAELIFEFSPSFSLENKLFCISAFIYRFNLSFALLPTFDTTSLLSSNIILSFNSITPFTINSLKLVIKCK